VGASLDPETNSHYGVGAKWDALEGNLSLRGLFRSEGPPPDLAGRLP
jgi:hypothetical protein